MTRGGHQLSIFTHRCMLTRPFERAAVAALSAVTAFVNPTRGDMIATLGETTGDSPSLINREFHFTCPPKSENMIFVCLGELLAEVCSIFDW